jgi:hypothetical protein
MPSLLAYFFTKYFFIQRIYKMFNYRINKETKGTKLRRLNNRFLYFFAFKLPLTASSSNRSIVNYFTILTSDDNLRGGKVSDINSHAEIRVLHNLIINNLFKFYL